MAKMVKSVGNLQNMGENLQNVSNSIQIIIGNLEILTNFILMIDEAQPS